MANAAIAVDDKVLLYYYVKSVKNNHHFICNPDFFTYLYWINSKINYKIKYNHTSYPKFKNFKNKSLFKFLAISN
jgi:hypothetical protein